MHVNYKTDFDETALTMASKNKDIDMLELLIKKGADTDCQDENGNTALLIAAQNGYFDIAKALIDNGCELNIEDQFEETALSYSIKYEYKELVSLLLKKGADAGNASVSKSTIDCDNEDIRNLVYEYM